MGCRPDCDKHVHSPEALLNQWANKLTNNQHCVWGSFGVPGSGKSEGNILLAIQLMDLLKERGVLRPDIKFSVKRQVAFKPLDRQKLAQMPGMRFMPILDDEATGEGGHKHRTMSGPNVKNAQDLDACRGRNQANGFAAPLLKRLADPIVDHLMGYMEFRKDHSCEWFEAVRGGDQWNPWVHWESRFTVDDVPWLQELYPDVGREYLAAKDDHMNGRRADADVVVLEEKFYSILSRAPTTA